MSLFIFCCLFLSLTISFYFSLFLFVLLIIRVANYRRGRPAMIIITNRHNMYHISFVNLKNFIRQNEYNVIVSSFCRHAFHGRPNKNPQQLFGIVFFFLLFFKTYLRLFAKKFIRRILFFYKKFIISVVFPSVQRK